MRSVKAKAKTAVRGVLQWCGFDLVRYPLASPLARTVRLLNQFGIDCVADVGANSGGFATAIRQLGYRGRIVSFEPLNEPFRELRAKSEPDDLWDAVKTAVGATKTEISINVSGNAALSSSVLPMLDAHREAAPGSRYVGVERVPQDRLDALLRERGLAPWSRLFLKLDVQGYEGAALEGAAGLFADGSIVGMQLELSLVDLYEGALPYRDAFDFAESCGMTLMGLDPVFVNSSTGQLLQADAVFFKSHSASAAE